MGQLLAKQQYFPFHSLFKPTHSGEMFEFGGFFLTSRNYLLVSSRFLLLPPRLPMPIKSLPRQLNHGRPAFGPG